MSKQTKQPLDRDTTAKNYADCKDKYHNLGINIRQALEIFLKEKGIDYLSIDYRVKDTGSFLDKIERKNYTTPFEQIEDICGLRIICHYQSDIEKIGKIIEDEFDVSTSENAEERLEADQFGYRSMHYIVKIKKKWLDAPNYRGLENLKAELQVRTVLMHAWADIAHKLAYKKLFHIPYQLQRNLSKISLKLEEADEQFELLKNDIAKYKETVKIEIAESNNKVQLNLDSLQAALDLYFPKHKRATDFTSALLDDFKQFNISLEDLHDAYVASKDFFEANEKFFYVRSTPNRVLNAVGAARVVIALVNDSYRKILPNKTFDYDKWSPIAKINYAELKKKRVQK